MKSLIHKLLSLITKTRIRGPRCFHRLEQAADSAAARPRTSALRNSAPTPPSLALPGALRSPPPAIALRSPLAPLRPPAFAPGLHPVAAASGVCSSPAAAARVPTEGRNGRRIQGPPRGSGVHHAVADSSCVGERGDGRRGKWFQSGRSWIDLEKPLSRSIKRPRHRFLFGPIDKIVHNF